MALIKFLRQCSACVAIFMFLMSNLALICPQHGNDQQGPSDTGRQISYHDEYLCYVYSISILRRSLVVLRTNKWV